MSWDKITEKQNQNSMDVDDRSTIEMLNMINSEDSKVSMAVKSSLDDIKAFIDALVIQFKKGGRLFYVGSGTSGRLGVLDAAECPPTFRTDPEMVQGIIAGGYDALITSIEGAEDVSELGATAIIERDINENDVVFGITASSTTPFVLGALEKAKTLNALTGLLTCNDHFDLSFIDYVISVVVGPEVITGSTRMKAGTATKMVLNMITTVSMIKLNKTYGNLMVDLKSSNEKLQDRGVRIIMHLTGLDHENAMKLLKSADDEVKTAVLMEKLQIEKRKAREILENNLGSLRNSLKTD
jgi:N-acetylmuramic acid 6-phosphate etherase